ncbi:hypothetical protein [Streptomyces californicus]|uniref:hypothetical protein n=1 Tax=Streptomyces californicus TaxID=67351 RepID=UPI0033DEAA88
MERAPAVSTAADDPLGIAYAEHQLSSIEIEQGEHRVAHARYGRARTTFRALGRDAAAALYQLSMLNADGGRPAEARTGFTEAQQVFTRLEDHGSVSNCHRSLAYPAEDDGGLGAAMEHCRSALALCTATGDTAQAEELRNHIGTLYVLTGNYEAAHAEFDAALRSAVARDAPEEVARSHQHLGVCARHMGALDVVAEHIRTTEHARMALANLDATCTGPADQRIGAGPLTT